MKNANVVMSVVLYCLSVSIADAQFYNGHKLARDLEAWSTPIDRADSKVMYRSGVGVGFLYGVCDALVSEGLAPLPSGINGDQLAVVVRDYLRKHPDQLQLAAARLVRDAINEKYGTIKGQRLTPKPTGDNAVGGMSNRGAVLPVPAGRKALEVIENSVGMQLVLVEAGEFLMGDDEHFPPHKVQITKPLFVGQTEVTQEQWERVMGTTPWNGKESVKENRVAAASYVSWDDATRFCATLTAMEHKAERLPQSVRYRLPTEAEWEYACRAGTSTRFSFGDDPSKATEYGWVDANSASKAEKYAHEVAAHKPNAWKLFEMHGNVSEWCSDWFDRDYYSRSPPDDPKGPETGDKRDPLRVLRGGCWLSGNEGSASRNGDSANKRYGTVGFRVVCEAFQPMPENTNDVTLLTVEQAEALAARDGPLRLNGVAALTDKTAAALVLHKGPLFLNGLTALSDEQARILSRHVGALSLDGLKTLSDAHIDVLAQHKGELSLGGLTTLSPASAGMLAKHEGWMALDGVTTLSIEAAAALAQHRGDLYLGGLKTLAAKAESLLRANPGIHLPQEDATHGNTRAGSE